MLAKEKGSMESNGVEISTRAREREKEREGKEDQRRAPAEQDFEQICQIGIFGKFARSELLANCWQICLQMSPPQFNSLIYILIPTLPLIVTISLSKFGG